MKNITARRVLTLFVSTLILNYSQLTLSQTERDVKDDLVKSFKALTNKSVVSTSSGSAQREFLLTLESQFELPVNKEDYLLTYYVEFWNQFSKAPESYDQLNTQFNVGRSNPEQFGYPVVSGDSLNSLGVMYWVKKHMSLNSSLNSFPGASYVRLLNVTINPQKSLVDRANNKITVVYSAQYEVTLNNDVQNYDPNTIQFKSPRNFFKLYYSTLDRLPRVDVSGPTGLAASALNFLKEKKLPQPQLKWRDITSQNYSPCLISNRSRNQQRLSLKEFMRRFNKKNAGCFLEQSVWQSDKILSHSYGSSQTQGPQTSQEVTVYPEYHELFKDNKLQVLLAFKKCRENWCSENAFGHKVRIKAVEDALKNMGFNSKLVLVKNNEGKEDYNYTLYSKKVKNLQLEVSVLKLLEPVKYEVSFWKEFAKNELILASYTPMRGEHFNRAYVEKYQILLSPGASSLGWARLIPKLDYKLLNFDSVNINFSTVSNMSLLKAVETMANTYSYYKKPKSEWVKDSSWNKILSELENDLSSQTYYRELSAHFVRNNKFRPSEGANPSLVRPSDFSTSPNYEKYETLLNLNNVEGSNPLYIERKLTFLYLSQALGAESSDYTSLKEKIQKVCERGRSKNRDDSKFFFRYQFFTNCSPRFVLAHSVTNHNGVHYPTGSYLEFIWGNDGYLKKAYLTENLEIDGYSFKKYFQDTAGVVNFHKFKDASNGVTYHHVEKGHLSKPTDFVSDFGTLKLNGGNGTSVIEFYDKKSNSVKNAQIKEDSSYSVGSGIYKTNLVLKGNVRGPQKVYFYPVENDVKKGTLDNAYLAHDTVINGFKIAGVNTQNPDVLKSVSSKEDLKVFFYSDGQLQTGVLAEDKVIDGVTYSTGLKITLAPRPSSTGNTQQYYEPKVQSPLLRSAQSNTYHRILDRRVKIPENSSMEIRSNRLVWLKLSDKLEVSTTGSRKHSFPKGAEVKFNREKITMVKSPIDADSFYQTYQKKIKVPAGAILYVSYDITMEFHGVIELSGLKFKEKNNPSDWQKSISFHNSGTVAQGTLAEDAVFSATGSHYENLPLKGGEKVRFSDYGNLTEGTLSAPYDFKYTFKDNDERPGDYCATCDSLPTVSLPVGSEVRLSNWKETLESVTLGEDWVHQSLLHVSKRSSLDFNDKHELTNVTFSEDGGSYKDFKIAKGYVRLYENGVPQSFRLAQDWDFNGLTIPVGTTLQLSKREVPQSITVNDTETVIAKMSLTDSKTMEFVKSVVFTTQTNVKSGILKDDFDYEAQANNTVKLAGVKTCKNLDLENSCEISFYPETKLVMKAISAKDFVTQDGSQVFAGQELEFNEDGSFYTGL